MLYNEFNLETEKILDTYIVWLSSINEKLL